MDNEEEGIKLIFNLLLNHHLHTRVTLVEASANYFFVILFVNAIGTSIYGFFNTALYSDQADFRFFRYGFCWISSLVRGSHKTSEDGTTRWQVIADFRAAVLHISK